MIQHLDLRALIDAIRGRQWGFIGLAPSIAAAWRGWKRGPRVSPRELERIWRRDLGLEPLTAKQAAVAFVVLSGLLSVALWFAFAL